MIRLRPKRPQTYLNRSTQCFHPWSVPWLKNALRETTRGALGGPGPLGRPTCAYVTVFSSPILYRTRNSEIYQYYKNIDCKNSNLI